jgi:uncharacterized repeat protein (TIGR01451 family)
LNINSLYQQSISPINIPSNGIVYSNQSTSNGYTSSEASLTVTNATADVAVTNSVSNNTPNYQDNVILTVTVQNNGPGTAENVSITESLNGNYLTWVSDDSNGTYNHNTGIWTIGTLTSGQTATIHITAKVNTPNITIINKATYNPVTTDPNSNNNNQTVTMTVPANNADIAVTNTVSNTTPQYNDTITFTITVKNNGPNTAQNVAINEWTSNGLTYVSDDSNGALNLTNGVWTIGTLISGQTAILHITAKVNTPNTTITNTATYNPVTTDPNSNNNNQTVTITVPANSADIAVTNTVSNTTPQYNDTIIFTITVKNNGPDTAQNVTIRDASNNSYLTYVSDDSNGTLNLTNGVWTIGTLTSGATVTLHITAKANTANKTITNTATYNPVTTDPNSTNNSQTVTITVT